MLLNMGQVRPKAGVSVEKHRRQEQESNSFYRPIANDDSTVEGINPHSSEVAELPMRLGTLEHTRY